jgi:hypothetical protein
VSEQSIDSVHVDPFPWALQLAPSVMIMLPRFARDPLSRRVVVFPAMGGHELELEPATL